LQFCAVRRPSSRRAVRQLHQPRRLRVPTRRRASPSATGPRAREPSSCASLTWPTCPEPARVFLRCRPPVAVRGSRGGNRASFCS
jgi:hypothetical protein